MGQRGRWAAIMLALLSSCARREKDPHLSIDLSRSQEDGAWMKGPLDVPSVASKCSPSVVVVVGPSKQGSGVIVRSNGWVVTNAHVVDDQSSLEIKLASGEKVPGKLLIAAREVDLAIVRLPTGKYPAAAMGDSDALKPGEAVVAIGAPLGLEQTISSGEVAAIREIRGEPLIQISVPVSHGSSGGGLFDRNGRLVGITTASLENGQNLNFAVPSSAVRKLLAKAPE